MRLSLLLACLSLPLISSTAFAQDEDEDGFDLDDFDEEEEDEEEVERLDAPAEGDEDSLDMPDEDEFDDLDFGGDPEDEELDFDSELDELGEDEIGGEGEDNVGIYRDFVDNMDDLGPEEELIAWERYLEEYPNTLFRDRIERRMDEITEGLYGQRIRDPNAGYKDAKDQEIELARPLVLENIDPRTHGHISVELGIPAYLSGNAEVEYALARQMSVRAAYRNRYTGGNLEVGAKYAFIKSKRLNLIATGIADFRYNTDPGYPAFRPQVAVGKVFDIGGGLHVQAQGGVDLELGRDPFSMRYVGGANITYIASETVQVFAEGSLNYKDSQLPGDYPNFQFHVLTFGIKFVPGGQPMTAGLAANVPVAYQYWGYHFGAVQADLNYYADDLLPKVF
ncbi:MAG: hypothetical protein VX899_10795 [Myxococcota bacterium]|nr:hypothetical protein [Myxococcota bacterium]